MKIAKLCLAFVSCVSTVAYADTDPNARSNEINVAAVGIHGVSSHARGSWNDANVGAYIKTNNNYVVGVYRNSEYRTSWYIGKRFSVFDAGPVQGDILVGAVSGYKVGTMPAVVPSISIKLLDSVALRTTLIPQISRYGSAAVHFSIEFDIE